jgi:hypothetical protein
LGVRERIGFRGIALRRKAMAYHQPFNATRNALRNTRHFPIAWRRHGVKTYAAIGILRINTIHCKQMEMNVNIQRISKALYESHRAAFWLLSCAGATRPAAQRAKNRLYKNVKDVSNQPRIGARFANQATLSKAIALLALHLFITI